MQHTHGRVYVGLLCGRFILKKDCSNSAYWTNSYVLWGWGRCFFTGVAKLNNQPLFPKEVVSKPMRMRVLFEITVRLFYMLAIAVTPFRYSRLTFGVTLGVLFFDEHLTFVMVLGSGLIVISGLFILSQSKQMKTSTQAFIGSRILRS